MDMKRSSNRKFAIAAALMAVGSAAIASPTSEWQYIGEFQPQSSKAGLASGPFQDAAGLGTRFDSSSWSSGSSSSNATRSSALTLDAQTAAAASDASAAASQERRRALAITSNTSPVVGSPAPLELTLWNFINSIRAQQTGNAFVQLQTAAANIDYTLNGVPAPVPLPPALWLFAGGLAALATGRFLVRGKAASRHASSLATA